MTETAGQALVSGVQILQRRPPVAADAIQTKRVAAYCRVSTDMESQASSLETQTTSFREMISTHPGWTLAGVYADEGLSGTEAANRTEFQRMIADCEAGRIDYVLTKSISRFARNTMDCLQYVRKLKDLGINVYFDETHFDTGSTSSEMLLSLFAAVAQEESHSISENMKWGIRKRFQAGKPRWTATYGFKKGENDEYVIDEEQAKGVRRVFELYTEGYTMLDIVDKLEKERIPPMNGGKWWPKSVACILHNEKYVGDVIMQKTYTIDHLTHKKTINDQTVVPAYYVKDHHAPIIDRKTFAMAETIAAMRDKRFGSGQYPYQGRIVCPFCGETLVRARIKQTAVWMCKGYREEKDADKTEQKSTACPPFAIQGRYIDGIVRDAYEQLDMEKVNQTANGSGQYVEPAKAALEWKKKCKRLGGIEYSLLDALVEKITFAKWTEAVVMWKFGMKTRVNVKYDKVSEIPNVTLERAGDEFTLDGETVTCGAIVQQRVSGIEKAVLEARERSKQRNAPGAERGD